VDAKRSERSPANAFLRSHTAVRHKIRRWVEPPAVFFRKFCNQSIEPSVEPASNITICERRQDRPSAACKEGSARDSRSTRLNDCIAARSIAVSRSQRATGGDNRECRCVSGCASSVPRARRNRRPVRSRAWSRYQRRAIADNPSAASGSPGSGSPARTRLTPCCRPSARPPAALRSSGTRPWAA
jgi:hypothetical protein